LLSCLMVAALVLSSCQAAEVEEEKEGETVVGEVIEKEVPKAEEEEEVVAEDKKEKEMVLDPATHKWVPKPQYGGTLTFASGSDSPYIDPWNGSAGNTIASYYLEKLALVDWAVDRNVFPWKDTSFHPFHLYRGHIAKSWDVVSPTHFIIHIRPGVTWQNLPPVNGREVTAYDVEWSYHRSLGLGSGFTEGTPNAPVMLGIPWESVTATDKYTVEVKLEEAVLMALPNFLMQSWEASWIVPREVIEQYGDLNDWRHAVGSGPFIVQDHVIDSSWTFVKNPDYWAYDEKFPENKLPYVDKVRLLIIPDYQTRLSALRTGKIVSQGAGIEVAETLRETNPELVETVSYGTTSQVYSIDPTDPPMDDVRVRKAMQMAINLPEIVDTYYEGMGNATPYHILGSACAGYRMPYEEWEEEWKEGYRYNPEGAKALLAEAGYPNGFEITMNVFTGWTNTDVLTIVQDYWQEVGIKLDYKIYDWGAFAGKIASKTNGPMGSWIGNNNSEPMEWCKCSFYGPTIWSQPINDPVYDEMVDRADRAANIEEQMRLIKEVEAYGIPKHWMIITPAGPGFGFKQPWFLGSDGEGQLGGGCSGALHAREWIDQDMKYEMTGIRD